MANIYDPEVVALMSLLGGEGGGGGGASALSDLTDVSLSTPAAGERFYYNGSKWVNSKVYRATLAAGSTTVTFSNLTLTASSRINIETTDGVWYDEREVDEINGEITLTFTAQASDIVVLLEVL